MRATVSILALMIATPALADDVFVQAPVDRAEIYPDGATLTLRASADLPAGNHTLMIAYPNAEYLEALPRISVSEGVTIGTLGFRQNVTADPRALYTPAQATAAEAVDAAEEALLAGQDELAASRATIDALEARLAYLSEVRPPKEGTPDEVLAMADLVASQTAQTGADLSAARALLRPLRDEVTELESAVTAAQAALDRLSPPRDTIDVLTVEVSVAEAGPVALEFTEQTWNAGWNVDYDVDLDREAGTITMDRKVIVMQETGRPWTGADITLSTARPSDSVGPSPVWPDKADLYVPMPATASRLSDSMAAPMAEPEMIMEEDAMKVAQMQVDGLSISYVYPDPVNLASGEVVELALDTLDMPAAPEIMAAPKTDDTAFLTARFTNDTGGPILPGTMRLSRDGAFVGTSELYDVIPNNAEEVMNFGPIEGLRLTRTLLRNNQGGAGIINKSTTRTQQITFSVENLTGEEQDVRALYPLTFSELDVLEVDVATAPMPTETDVEDKRGVAAWDMTLAPGETQSVEITVDLDWPEGQQLNWRP